MGDPVNAAQQSAEQGHEVRYARQYLVGVERECPFRQVGAETESVEWDGRQQHYGRAADLGLAEDVRHVLARIVVDALLGFFQQFVAIAELGGAGGADFRASRLFSVSYAFAAHNALAHAGYRFVPFVLGHAEGTSRHAVAASHATALVVSDGPERGLLHRAHWAYRGARRVVAVHAQLAHELVVLDHDRRVFARRCKLLGGDAVIVRQAVFGGAGLLALLAADAQGCIVEDSLTHAFLHIAQRAGRTSAGGKRRQCDGAV